MSIRSPLVCQHLERISGAMLEKYQHVIRDYVARRHGIYALYRRGKLYYVGLAKNLRGRLRSHLRDRHAKKWDQFSVYLTIGDQHLKELESLVLRIVQTDGNRVRGRFARSDDLRKRLTRDLREQFKRDLRDAMGWTKQPVRTKVAVRKPKESRAGKVGQRALVRVLPGPIHLRAEFKGKVYRAVARADGSVRLGGELYDSLSAAGKAIRKRATNGW